VENLCCCLVSKWNDNSISSDFLRLIRRKKINLQILVYVCHVVLYDIDINRHLHITLMRMLRSSNLVKCKFSIVIVILFSTSYSACIVNFLSIFRKTFLFRGTSWNSDAFAQEWTRIAACHLTKSGAPAAGGDNLFPSRLTRCVPAHPLFDE